MKTSCDAITEWIRTFVYGGGGEDVAREEAAHLLAHLNEEGFVVVRKDHRLTAPTAGQAIGAKHL